MIVFVGDKPSKKNIDPNVAFVGTKSYKTLLGWIADMDIDIDNVKLTNYIDFFTRPIDHPILFVDFEGHAKELALSHKFIALGSIAENKLKKIGVDYFKLPHPSRLNRRLNNKKWLNKQLKECKKWLNNDNTH